MLKNLQKRILRYLLDFKVIYYYLNLLFLVGFDKLNILNTCQILKGQCLDADILLVAFSTCEN